MCAFFSLLCAAVAFPVLICCCANAQENNYAELAARIVKTSANLKPGDVVVVAGGKHNLALTEALAIEAKKQGGLVTVFYDSDAIERATFKDVPEQYLDLPPTFFADWLKHTNVYIGLPGVEDSKAVFEDIPPERLARAYKAGQVVNDVLDSSGVRVVNVGYPTQSDASVNQLDFAAFQKAYWDAVGADYQRISNDGAKLKSLLQGAKSVRVTSPAGTDFTFAVGDRAIFIDDGIMTDERAKSKNIVIRAVSLPSGEVFVAPIETSANGRVVVPRDQCYFKPVMQQSFDLMDGHLKNYKAETGADCFEKMIGPYDGPKDVFAYFQIGLNPAAKVIEDPGDYRPAYAAGLVTIGFGDNQILGGNNKVVGGVSFPFSIVNATVTIDGKTVVRDGKLEM